MVKPTPLPHKESVCLTMWIYALRRLSPGCIHNPTCDWIRSVKTAIATIRRLSRFRPTLALVLGSGFNHALREMDVDARIAYARLPGFPKPSVAGHAGELIIGKLAGTPTMVLSGRAHYYEGNPIERVTFPIRVLAACGIRDLLLTNAAGGINQKFSVGDFMVLTDHINLMGVNPLRGGPCFVDMTQVYDVELGSQLELAGRATNVKLQRGVYLAVSGPSYETPAEIRAFARLGADAVGMSTVPEAIVARHCDMRVAALSCITNLAAGISKSPLSHHDVLETGRRVKLAGARLLKEFAKLHG